jgi:hypothetical protein
MIKQRSLFYLLCCSAVLPWGQAIAQDIKNQPCSFNGGRWIQTGSVCEGKGFRLYNPKSGNKIVCDQAVTSNAFNAGKTTQCFSVQKEVLTDDGTSLGYYRAHASLMESAGSALVSFSVTMPDTDQVLEGNEIKATRVSPTSYKFRFVDAWGNSSKGLLAILGKRAMLTHEVDKYGSPSNVSRNYGETNLNSSSCK